MTWILTIILILTLVCLVSGRVPVDLTALGIVLALVVLKILTPAEAVAGFAHPAVITVGAMFLISRGMMRTGAVAMIGRQVTAVARGSRSLALLLILVVVAAASAFINNTPVVILFVPVVMTMCCEYGLSPSQFLIPISYVSILAGTCTLIGTSTNIIISDLSAASGFGGLKMFELAILGVPLAILGIIFIWIAAPRIMPSLANPICQFRDGEHRRYLAELKIPKGSRLVGMAPQDLFGKRNPGLEILEVIRYSHIYHPERDPVITAPDDLLLIKGSVNDIVDVLKHEDVELPRTEKDLSFGAGKDETIVVELIVPPQSSLLGQRLLETQLMRDPDLHVIAMKRSGLHYTEKQLHDIRLRIGDIILIWCSHGKLTALRANTNVIIAEDVHEEIVHKRKAWIAGLIFGAMIVTATLGILNIMTAALAAVFLMLVTGCLQLREAYRSLQADVLMLIIGTIALGTAMEKTGTSRIYAESFLSLFAGFPPVMVLGALMLLTSISTQILSNNATAVLLFPIAVSTALGLGVSPKPFVIAVCFGASACFATPIGYQTNLLVYGPGGYRFTDYLKLGLPLNLMILLAGMGFIPIIWPF